MSEAPLWFNPADYFTFVLDQEIRAAGMPGGHCGFVLELESTPDLARLQSRLDLLVQHFPQASGRLERRGKRYAWVPTGERIALMLHPGGDAEACRAAVVGLINRPAPLNESAPLSLHWVSGDNGGLLMLQWLHPLLDATGGKILLEFLCSADPQRFRDGPSLIGERLAKWSFWKKSALFLKAKRHNDQCNRVDSCLPTRAEDGSQALRLRVRRYSEEDSRQINVLAQQTMGLAGKTLYTIGCFMRAMERSGPPVAKAGYCVPYAFNLRRQNAPTPVFANHVSCLFARATREQAANRGALMSHLLADYRRTVADELDYAYLPSMWLGQWLSPARYARLLRKQRSGGELSSLWFSDVGEQRFGGGEFLGAPVRGVFHLCWMTLPPGLALLAGQANGQVTLSFNYLHPAVDEAWLEQLVSHMDAELLGIDF